MNKKNEEWKVEPNTEEVDFGDLYGIRLNFDCNKKSFPSVKRLRFGNNVFEN